MAVSICIVGAPGLIGKRHTQHALDEPRVDLTCIIDPTPTGEQFAADKGLTLYKSVDEMLEARRAGKVKVDGAILATPNATHVPLGLQMMQAGIHALVEKPFSTDIASGRSLVAAEKASSAKILVGQHRRFNPYALNCKKLVDSGKLGKILAVQGVWATLKPLPYFEAPTEWRKASGTGGPVLINLVHCLDLLRFWFGNVVRVYCEVGESTRGHAVEETGACTLKFASGMVGTFIFSDAAASPYNFESATGENPLLPQTGEPTYTVLGTRGSLSFPQLQTWHYTDPSHSWTDSLVQDDALAIDPTPPFTHQLRHFADVCEGTVEPQCGGEDALCTIITLEAILESMKTGNPVDIAQG
ncbi:Gfo/Idh/MocA family protein [Rhodotorula paludigena]|uniref:Gfo/Idh/MocA family protein n=1 Tax=Rhodotorula paludigena TaxID=86838 RepID=UPI003176BFFD